MNPRAELPIRERRATSVQEHAPLIVRAWQYDVTTMPLHVRGHGNVQATSIAGGKRRWTQRCPCWSMRIGGLVVAKVHLVVVTPNLNPVVADGGDAGIVSLLADKVQLSQSSAALGTKENVELQAMRTKGTDR